MPSPTQSPLPTSSEWQQDYSNINQTKYVALYDDNMVNNPLFITPVAVQSQSVHILEQYIIQYKWTMAWSGKFLPATSIH